MDIGKLNKRITIEKYTTTTNDNGFDIEDWIKFKTVWSNVNNIYGKEFWSAKQVNSENTVNFTIRYSNDFKELNSKEYRIVFNNRCFNITFIDNIKYENKYLKIKAIEVL